MVISTADSCTALRWTASEWTWQAFKERCSTPLKSPETMQSYLSLSRGEQSRLKDVGGFVAATFKDCRRKKEDLLTRTAVTLDIDHGRGDTAAKVAEVLYGINHFLYTTRKSTPEAPRYRLCVELSHPVDLRRYDKIAHMLMGAVGEEVFDATGAEPERMFFWPSVCADGDFRFLDRPGIPMDADRWGAAPPRPTEHGSPSRRGTQPDEGKERESVSKTGDPRKKRGVVGAFCRAYTISQAMRSFIPDAYEPAGPNRYRYRQSTGGAGAVAYDDLLLFSYHESDPAGVGNGRHCRNAFDLVRLHKGLDFKGMCEFARKDPATAAELHEAIRFEDIDPQAAPGDPRHWSNALDTAKDGTPKGTPKNAKLILLNDPTLAGCVSLNLFDDTWTPGPGVPWQRDPSKPAWTDDDEQQLRMLMDENHGYRSNVNLHTALAVVAQMNARNPVTDWLGGLQWDGVCRLETSIIDHLGAEDNAYTRYVAKAWFTAVVARAFKPGYKFDNCLLLIGPEACGKSSFFAIMGGEYHAQVSLCMFNDPKRLAEIGQGALILEMDELAGMGRTEVEAIKSSLTATSDTYRKAYAQNAETRKRHFCFCATSNNRSPLIGDTGQRRWWPVDIQPELRRYDAKGNRLRQDREQLWAEAVHWMRDGFSTDIHDHPEALEQAREQQRDKNASSDDPVREVLADYLALPLPPEFPTWTPQARATYVQENMGRECVNPGYRPRYKFTVPAFLLEALGKDPCDMRNRPLLANVNAYMRENPQWVPRRVRLYGQKFASKGYARQECAPW